MKPGIKVPVNNQAVDSHEMEFQAEGDGLIVVKIEDGTELEIRHVITAIYKAVETDANGQPQYFIMGGSSVSKKFAAAEENVPELKGVS
jgi:hypothetical protein